MFHTAFHVAAWQAKENLGNHITYYFKCQFDIKFEQH